MSPLDRRTLLAVGLGSGVSAVGIAAQPAAAGPRTRDGALAEGASPSRRTVLPASATALEAGSERDQSPALQAAIDAAQVTGAAVQLPPGRFRVGGIVLRSGTRLIGQGHATRLAFGGGRHFIAGSDVDNVSIEHLTLDGAGLPLADDNASGLLSLARASNLRLDSVTIEAAARDGVSLVGCSGRISDCTIRLVAHAGLRSLDAHGGLDIARNHVSDCSNNGILVWRSKAGEDGTRVSGNTIERILAAAGGSGQNGNGINVFRAGKVLVTGNRIADCAYSAIRGNAASDIQMVANTCTRIGEVALYAEFGFEGALIASNIVDTAACGISVTNFNDGGRLAVVQGNLVRNLFRREQEKEDKRGEGITVEADAVVTGNTIEGAPTCGIKVGNGPYQRDVSLTGNLIRASRVGIMVSAHSEAGVCLISGNLISGARDGAIRAHDHGRVVGPDLARTPAQSSGASARLSLVGNVVA